MQYDITGNEQRVLSIYPTKTGFSFAYFEKATNLVDWGNVHASIGQFSSKVEQVIESLNPEVLVTEDYKGSGSRRGKKAECSLKKIYEICEQNDVFFRKYSRAMVKGIFDCFDAHNKYDSAKLVASWLPELQDKLPPKPEIWMTTSKRMGVFDAVCFAIAYFYTVN